MPRYGQPGGPAYAQKRPGQDSVALIDCSHSWCSAWAAIGSVIPDPGVVLVQIGTDNGVQVFCSPGCASRWLIRYELRTNPLPVHVLLPPRPKAPARGQSESSLIRTWAREQGFAVAGKGYLAKELVAAYREAHP